jgi:hypothetical protein
VLNAVPSSEADENDIMYNTDDHWKQWGEQDPYFGVLSLDKFRKESSDDNRTEFFESGAEVVSRVIAMATRQFGQFNRGSALDFGSGVGRLTNPAGPTVQKCRGRCATTATESLVRQFAGCGGVGGWLRFAR